MQACLQACIQAVGVARTAGASEEELTAGRMVGRVAEKVAGRVAEKLAG